jgi:hypothetical protein
MTSGSLHSLPASRVVHLYHRGHNIVILLLFAFYNLAQHLKVEFGHLQLGEPFRWRAHPIVDVNVLLFLAVPFFSFGAPSFDPPPCPFVFINFFRSSSLSDERPASESSCPCSHKAQSSLPASASSFSRMASFVPWTLNYHFPPQISKTWNWRRL